MYCYLGFFETIQPQLYAHYEKCLCRSAEVFDTIPDDEKIIARAQSVTKHYDAFTEAADALTHLAMKVTCMKLRKNFIWQCKL